MILAAICCAFTCTTGMRKAYADMLTGEERSRANASKNKEYKDPTLAVQRSEPSLNNTIIEEKQAASLVEETQVQHAKQTAQAANSGFGHFSRHAWAQHGVGSSLVTGIRSAIAALTGHADLSATETSAKEVSVETPVVVVEGEDFLTQLLVHPNILIFYIFVCLWILGGVRTWIAMSGESRAASQEVKRKRDALQGAYVSSVAEVEGILLGMAQSSAYLAEWNFETKRRDLEKWMISLRDKPQKFLGGSKEMAHELFEPFMGFIGSWICIFEQVSLRPAEEPNLVLQDEDWSLVNTFVDLAGMCADRLGKSSVSLIQPWIKSVRKLGFDSSHEVAVAKWIEFGCFGIGWGFPSLKRKSGDDSDSETDNEEPPPTQGKRFPFFINFLFVRFTIMSSFHLLLIVIPFFGLVNLVIQGIFLAQDQAIASGVLLLGSFILLYFIDDIDEVSRLQLEVDRLQQVSAALGRHHEELKAFYGEMNKLGNLWRFRTLPSLEHFEHLRAELENLPIKDRAQYLNTIVDAWEEVEEGVCGIQEWLDGTVDEDLMKLCANQINHASQTILQAKLEPNLLAIAEREKRMFGFLVVRVLAGFNLTNKGSVGRASNPYVVLSLSGKARKESWRTQTIKHDLNPKWGEEFFLPTHPTDTHLELHVLTGEEGDSESLGYVHINFREMNNGAWYKQKPRLISVKKGTEKESTILYEMLYAASIRELVDAGVGPS